MNDLLGPHWTKLPAMYTGSVSVLQTPKLFTSSLITRAHVPENMLLVYVGDEVVALLFRFFDFAWLYKRGA